MARKKKNEKKTKCDKQGFSEEKSYESKIRKKLRQNYLKKPEEKRKKDEFGVLC